MKGKDGHNLKHGIDQIKSLRQRLQEEFGDHLPPRFRLHIQAILLSPPNSQTPKSLAEQGKKPFILPLQYSNRAELFPYISRKHEKLAKYQHTERRTPRQPSQSEKLFCTSQTSLAETDGVGRPRVTAQPPEGIHLKYQIAGGDCEVTFVTNPNAKLCRLVVNSRDTTHAETLRSEFEECGLLNTKFSIDEAISPESAEVAPVAHV